MYVIIFQAIESDYRAKRRKQHLRSSGDLIDLTTSCSSEFVYSQVAWEFSFPHRHRSKQEWWILSNYYVTQKADIFFRLFHCGIKQGGNVCGAEHSQYFQTICLICDKMGISFYIQHSCMGILPFRFRLRRPTH